MLLGASTLNLDAKGRMAIPAKYRDKLTAGGTAGVVVTINPREDCLSLYPEDEWRRIATEVARLPTMDPLNVGLQRLLLGNASEQELDGQGRISIAPGLREHAGLDKKILLVGQMYKFEIWDEEAWKSKSVQWADDIRAGVVEESGPLGGIVF